MRDQAHFMGASPLKSDSVFVALLCKALAVGHRIRMSSDGLVPYEQQGPRINFVLLRLAKFFNFCEGAIKCAKLGFGIVRGIAEALRGWGISGLPVLFENVLLQNFCLLEKRSVEMLKNELIEASVK